MMQYLLFSALAFLAVPLDTPEPPRPTKEARLPDYYPLRPGTRWEYEVEFNGEKSSNIVVVTGIEKIGGVDIACLDRTTHSDHFAANEKGVFCHRIDEAPVDPPWCVLKYPIKEGDTWQSYKKIGPDHQTDTWKTVRFEDIEVPAGKFKAVLVHWTTEVDGKETSVADSWFVQDVGLVKGRLEGHEGKPFSYTYALKKFTPGPR